MGGWLERLKADKPPEGGFVGFVASPQGDIQKNETPNGGFVGFVAYPRGGLQKNRGDDGAETRPKPSDPYAIGASWRPLAAAYYRHHFGCKTCISAGRGHGNRCPAGAGLWADYEAAIDAAHDTNTKGRSTR